MLLTAIAATLVIVPWAVEPAAGHHPQPARPGDTQLSQQPLIGLGGGVAVREISQARPFSMVAATSPAPQRGYAPAMPTARGALGMTPKHWTPEAAAGRRQVCTAATRCS
jgi:hypothetical protein